MPGKAKYVCVLIRSALAIMTSNDTVADHLARPSSKFQSWAPWMLKFCFRFNNKCSSEQQEQINNASTQTQLNQAIIASHGQPSAPDAAAKGADSNPLLTKGPYLLVYGETEEEREITWARRADATFQLLSAFISGRGGQPDNLMPEDAFAPDAGAAANSSSSSSATEVVDLTEGMAGPLMFGGENPGGEQQHHPMEDYAALGGAMTDEDFARYLQESGGL